MNTLPKDHIEDLLFHQPSPLAHILLTTQNKKHLTPEECASIESACYRMKNALHTAWRGAQMGRNG